MGGASWDCSGYVKADGRRIFVRSDQFSGWPALGFTPTEARSVAARLIAHADTAEGKTPTKGWVVLNLTRSQAEALASVLNRVGGNPTRSPRGKTQAVYRKLLDGGVKVPEFKFETVAGGLWFKDYDGRGADELTRSYAEVFYAFAGAD